MKRIHVRLTDRDTGDERTIHGETIDDHGNIVTTPGDHFLIVREWIADAIVGDVIEITFQKITQMKGTGL